MTELQARQALLLRAHEQPMTAPWTEADAAAVTRQALFDVGEHAAAERFIAARAKLGVARLAQRGQAASAALAATGSQRGLVWLTLALAVLAGALADAAGAVQRINLLAPPWLALLAWNALVYAALAGALLRGSLGQRAGDGSARGAHAAATSGPLRRALAMLEQRLVQRAAWAGTSVTRASGQPADPLDEPAAVSRFIADWWHLGAPLNGARLASVLHAAAAAFALAGIASLYVRGLGFEYRAGWDSTFLSGADVHDWLTLLYAPARALAPSLGPLPDADALATLRFSIGPGDNAARWIHWQAITVALFVVLPRALLAAGAAWRAHRMAQRFPLPLTDPHFARLARLPGGEVMAVQVLPYNYQLLPSALPGLDAALEKAFEQLLLGAVKVTLLPSVPLGAEDDLDAALPGFSQASASGAAANAASAVIALFALTATPEREAHGAFVGALAARLGTAARLLVCIDESGFRQRFTGADAAIRIEQRREAWRRMLVDLGLDAHQAPQFVDLRSAE